MPKDIQKKLQQQAIAAKQGAKCLAKIPGNIKDMALRNIAKEIIDRQNTILEANNQDYIHSKELGLSESLLDRLLLTPSRLLEMAGDVERIADLPDPIGETFDMRTMPNGL